MRRYRKIKLFFINLSTAIFCHGKFLIGYILNEIPGLTSFPGFMTVLNTAVHDGTKAAYRDLAIQLLLAFAAAHRTGKVLDKVITATKDNERL